MGSGEIGGDLEDGWSNQDKFSISRDQKGAPRVAEQPTHKRRIPTQNHITFDWRPSDHRGNIASATFENAPILISRASFATAFGPHTP